MGGSMGDDVLPHPFVLRPLAASDFHKGYLQLLEQLTVVGEVSEDAFKRRMEQLEKLEGDHHIAVIEDVEGGRVVATGSILIEHKFIHSCGKVGHIEDVVVDHTVRGQHLGERVVRFLTNFAKEAGCYKVILDSDAQNSAFYEKCGYSNKGVEMAKYF